MQAGFGRFRLLHRFRIHRRRDGNDEWGDRDVLIGTFRNREQFAICKAGNFYYIPAELVPEEYFPVRYVAMFRTPRIFGKQAGIAWYGRVTETKLVQRKYIREVPVRYRANPDALYYRFTIRRWELLERNIAPKEAGFVSGFTNLFLLKHAEFVPELLLGSYEEYQSYILLKAIAREGSGELPMGRAVVMIRDGSIHLIREGQCLDRCPLSEFFEHPTSVFHRLWEKSRIP